MLAPHQMFFFFREKKRARTVFRPIGATVDLEKCEKNAYLDAKIGVDTDENGPSKVLGPKCGFGSWYM